MSKLNPLNGYLVLKPIEEEEQTVLSRMRKHE